MRTFSEKKAYDYKELLECCIDYINDNIRKSEIEDLTQFEIIVNNTVKKIVDEHYYNNRTFDIMSLIDYFEDRVFEAELDNKPFSNIIEALESLLPKYLENDLYGYFRGEIRWETI